MQKAARVWFLSPGNSIALGDTLVKFFEEEFYKDVANHRRRIQEYSRNHHSWEIVAQITEGVYRGLIKPSSTTESVKVATACKVREGSRPGARENADGPTIEKAETGDSMGGLRNELSYVLISPSRNEARFIGETLDSVVSQTVRPLKWVIVNDGSTDATGEIAAKYAERYDWIEVINRPIRKSGILLQKSKHSEWA